jgi:hypothetical protein
LELCTEFSQIVVSADISSQLSGAERHGELGCQFADGVEVFIQRVPDLTL